MPGAARCALTGVRELLTDVAERGFRVVLVSSGGPDQVDAHLDLFGGEGPARAWTTSEDVDATEPAPDLLDVALERAGGRRCGAGLRSPTRR